jgi:hypothetical protein
MKTERLVWSQTHDWHSYGPSQCTDAQLCIYFSASNAMTTARFATLRARFPFAQIVGCTSGGEISGNESLDDAISVMALTFDHSAVRAASVSLASAQHSSNAALELARAIPHEGLRAVFVLCDGLRVNGSTFVKSLRSTLPQDTVIVGGLAGDGARFVETGVGFNAPPVSNAAVIVGLYGERLRVGYGSGGGWRSFGPVRTVTRSDNNLLYELDGVSALELYKRYLGDEAAALPGSALLYPLALRCEKNTSELVRTVLSIDHHTNAMRFAGDVPEGSKVRLMRGMFEDLVSGAAEAAVAAQINEGATVAILVSCIGRKLLMGQRVNDEIDAVSDVLGSKCETFGYYSYGEISPHAACGIAEFHNQTMTITTLAED